MGSGLWLQIDISQAGAELRATARSSRGEEPPAHLLGPRSAPELIRQFGEWVKKAAMKAVPLAPLSQPQELYQALIQQGLQQTLHQLQGSAQGEAVLLRLNPTDNELHGVPWEALCRPETTVDFLGTSREVYLARGASSLKPWAPCRLEEAVRLLVISPSDPGAPERLKAVLHTSLQEEELKWFTPLTGSHASAAYLFERLRGPSIPHILHFIGHGGFDSEGHPTLRLADKDGEETWIKVELLAKALEPHTRDTLRLVILEACEGAQPSALASAAALLVQAGVGAVVAHLWPVRADVARRCSAVFYRSLLGTASHRGNVARSIHDTRLTLMAEFRESAEAFSPVLYLRGHEPILFDFQARKARPPGSPTTQSPEVEPAAHTPGHLGRAELLMNLLRQPFSLLPGEDWRLTQERLRLLLHARLRETQWSIPESSSLRELAQVYALRFGSEALDMQFRDATPSLGLIEALAQRLPPGIHVTLQRLPVLEQAIARHQPALPLFVIHPSLLRDGATVFRRHVVGQGWVSLDALPDAFDLKSAVLLLRLYRSSPPDQLSDKLPLTEDDFLLGAQGLESMLPPKLVDTLLSGLYDRPTLLLGLSLSVRDHQLALHHLFGHRPLPRRSTVLLEPGDAETLPWQNGRGLPGGAGLQVVQAATAELTKLLVTAEQQRVS